MESWCRRENRYQACSRSDAEDDAGKGSEAAEGEEGSRLEDDTKPLEDDSQQFAQAKCPSGEGGGRAGVESEDEESESEEGEEGEDEG